MSKKTLPLTLLWVLLLSLCSQSVSAPKVTIPNQDHFIQETIYDMESVDPAWAIDTGSRALIFNVYDTLVFFDQEEVDEFIPYLAADWRINQPPHPDAPPGTCSTWYFRIREGVKFHNGDVLTTKDVEYSFERLMVMDRTGGPAWKIFEPLLGVYHADMDWAEDEACPINLAVQCNSTHIWLNLAIPYPPLMQILCGSWASVVNVAFCVGHGCWDGDWTHWKDYHDPEHSPLDYPAFVMCGTGPYMLDYWTPGVEWSIVAFNKEIAWPMGYDTHIEPPHDYEHWQQWPAPRCSRYLDRVTNKVVYEWGTRHADFIGGIADEVYVPTAYIPDLIENWPTAWDEEQMRRVDERGDPEYYAERIRCLPGLPTLAIDPAIFFTFDINPASPYVGTGSFPDGIPLDFFSDRRIRQAFAYSFDYDEFLEAMFWGEAEQPPSCVIKGILYHNPNNPKFSLDPYAAAALFQAASADSLSPAYQVWDQGFTMIILYNTGNILRETTAYMLKDGVEGVFELGPDGEADTGDEAPGTASISTLAVPWPTYLGELYGIPTYKSLMPLFIIGWLADYPDPHNWVTPFMHSEGYFTGFQSYSNATVDALIEWGIATPDGPEREAIYHMLQLMYYQDAPSVCIAQPYGRHWERDWVQGWHYNPLFPGQKYFKHMWKGLNGDINGDNRVDILDVGMVSAHWYPGPPEGHLGYDKIADVCPELQYNGIPKVWDAQAGQWVPHPSIGAVDIYDAALISAHWLEEVDP